DDDIETLKSFDVDTQRSGDDLDAVAILPAREVPLDPDGVRRFRQNYRARFAGEAARSPVYRDVSDGIAHGGIEYYLPLFFDTTASLVDYLPASTRVLAPADLDARLAEAFAAVAERYELVSLDADKPALEPAEAFHEPAAIRRALSGFPSQRLQREKALGGHDFGARVLPPLRPAADGSAPLADFVRAFDGRILYSAESPGRRESLSEYLRDQGIAAQRVEGWDGFRNGDGAAALVVAPFLEGCVIRAAGVAIIPEQAVFGQRVRQRRRRRRAAKDLQAVIGELSDLRPGAPVVHVDYGVGRYLKLATLDIGGYTDEYVTLEYAGGDKLYVPVHSLDRISRYTGAAPEQAPLHRLGSDQWERAQRKAAERARDVAAELLDVYARRAAREGHRFHYSEQDYRAFAGAFPFELTEDQADAIEAIIADMRSAEPMDRVVCGDVGFGKTEVALRAAFIAVEGGKQVAMLVPTTLLAQQHHQTFRDRFADWPFRVEVLSRFRSGKQSDAVLTGLRSGSVDIVIGTHKLLQHLDAFADVGLVIVDEEHRFGVRQKEAIKNLRAEVDVLTLTATPIPRT
ncbi:MAG: DEAD/DEAH box helicase, partial [Pseudomonadota bacterium]